MKKTSVLLIAIVIIVLALPKFVGSVVEAEYQSMVKLINENPMLTIKNTKFERHWFGAVSVNEISFQVNGSPLDDVAITVTEQLSFGPVIFSDDGLDFALSHSQATMHTTSTFIDEEIETFIAEHVKMSGLLTFSKNIISRIRIEEATKEADGNHLIFHPAFAEFTIEDNKRIFGDFNWGGIEITGADGALTIGNVTADFDEEVILGDIYAGNAISTGQGKANIELLHIVGDGQAVDIINLLLFASAEVKDDLMDVHINYHANEIKSAGMVFENANIDLLLSNLDINVLQEFNTIFAEMSKRTEQTDFSEQDIADLSALTSKLLESNPLLMLKDLSVEMAEGKIVSELTLSIDKQKFNANNMMSGINAANLKGKGSATEAVLAKLGLMPMVNTFIEQGLLLRVDDQITYQVLFKNGQLSVNGHVIPL